VNQHNNYVHPIAEKRLRVTQMLGISTNRTQGGNMQLYSKAVLGALLILGCATTQTVHAQAPQSASVIFENVRIFSGTSGQLSEPSNVLVAGSVIKSISSAPIATPPATSVTRIQGSGRTLMPGLIDAHTHIMFATLPQAAVLTSDIGFVHVAATKAATDMMMRGFTSIRDLGGTDTAYALAKKFKIRTAWGTDTLFSAENVAKQGATLAKMVRWYTPAEVLKMATADNAELLVLSGLRSPYNRQAWRRPGRRAGGLAAGGRRPDPEHQADRGSGEELPRDHEGREDL
jgi:imidazolonepropionase-like amidohydrolase